MKFKTKDLILMLAALTSGCFSLRPRQSPVQKSLNRHPAVAPEECTALEGSLVPTYWPFGERNRREAQCNLEVYPTTVGWIAMPVYVPAVIIGVLSSPLWAPLTED